MKLTTLPTGKILEQIPGMQKWALSPYKLLRTKNPTALLGKTDFESVKSLIKTELKDYSDGKFYGAIREYSINRMIKSINSMISDVLPQSESVLEGMNYSQDKFIFDKFNKKLLKVWQKIARNPDIIDKINPEKLQRILFLDNISLKDLNKTGADIQKIAAKNKYLRPVDVRNLEIPRTTIIYSDNGVLEITDNSFMKKFKTGKNFEIGHNVSIGDFASTKSFCPWCHEIGDSFKANDMSIQNYTRFGNQTKIGVLRASDQVEFGNWARIGKFITKGFCADFGNGVDINYIKTYGRDLSFKSIKNIGTIEFETPFSQYKMRFLEFGSQAWFEKPIKIIVNEPKPCICVTTKTGNLSILYHFQFFRREPNGRLRPIEFNLGKDSHYGNKGFIEKGSANKMEISVRKKYVPGSDDYDKCLP